MSDPTSETPSIPAPLHWLFAVLIYYKPDGSPVLKERIVQVLITSMADHINMGMLGKVQQNAQVQAHQRKLIPNNGKIIDCVIISQMLLGSMTLEQFQVGAMVPDANVNSTEN